MSLIKSADELPEVSFIGDITMDELRAKMIKDYCDKYEELTGRPTVLPAADKNRILLGVCALQIYQAFQFIERAGKMNLIKYATGNFLDNLAALRGLTRNEQARSKVTIRFVRHENIASDLTIPASTRVTTENYEIFWETPNIDITMPAGRDSIEIDCYCTQKGSFSNGFEYGEIDQLAETVAFISSVYNINTSEGGSDYESDDDFRIRILNAPSGYSAAGAADSYRYCIKQLDDQIADVYVENGENDGEITAYILTKSGQPSEDQVAAYQDLVDNADFKPLTDSVTVAAATPSPYGIYIKYYISRKNANKVTSIKTAVEDAIDKFIAEQKLELGKDVNPSALIQSVMNAGACRLIVNLPSFMSVKDNKFSMLTTRITQYMGLE